MTAAWMPLPSSTGEKLSLLLVWFGAVMLTLVLLGIVFAFLCGYLSRHSYVKRLRGQIAELNEAACISGTVTELRQGDAGQLLVHVSLPASHGLPPDLWLTVQQDAPAPGREIRLCVIDRPERRIIMTEQDRTASALQYDLSLDKAVKKANLLLAVTVFLAVITLPPLIFSLDYFFTVFV